MMQMFGCQPILLNPEPSTQAVLEYLCTEANKLTNQGLYYARQWYFKTGHYITKHTLSYEYKCSKHFQALYSQVAQQTLIAVFESFKSYRSLLKLWRAGELKDRPKLPNYRTKGGLAVVSYPKQALKLEDDQIRLPLGKLTHCWFGLDHILLPMPSNLKFDKLKEVRILPRNGVFYAEFVYRLEPVKVKVDPARALGIDHGIDNWLICISNVGTGFIIDGHHIKSLNRWYNKQVSVLKENKPQGFWSKRLADITEKRNRQMRDAINKAARLVITHCIKHQISTIVFGWNPGQKDGANMGRKTNQKFVQIPTARAKQRIAQLAEQHSMVCIEHEEANTSAASFLDGDSLPAHGEKPVGWHSSGKRVRRGLFRTRLNQYINADGNAAANMLAKVSTTLGLDLSGVCRGALTRPTRIPIWVTAKSASAGLESHAL